MSRQASGLKAWALQRLTAIYVALYTLYLVGVLLFAAPADHAAWKAWLTQPLVGVTLLLFVASVLLHAWIGVRDVVIDYVKPIAIRAGVLGALGLVLVALGFWAAQVLLVARLS